MAWALLWPRPRVSVRPTCPHYLPRCEVLGGRVLYHTNFGAGRRAHLVLISSRSVTLPGVVVAEFPGALTHAPAGFSIGDWVMIAGEPTTGSHGERDLHIVSFASASHSERCGTYRRHEICRLTRRWPTWW